VATRSSIFSHIGITSQTESEKEEGQSFKLSVIVFVIAFTQAF
jgi:hypothetical protein